MSERNEPADPRHEEALAAALHAEAESVRTSGDGLIRIRARVERRRRRTRLLVPVASTAAVAATVTAIVATGMLSGSGNKPGISALDTTSPATLTPTATKPPVTVTAAPVVPTQQSVSRASAAVVLSSATTSISPPVTSVVAGGPPGPVPVWPFADKAAADAWQKTAAGSADQWHLDARATAQRFVQSLGLPKMALQQTPPKIAADGSATVDLDRLEPQTGKAVVLGTVRLAHWTTGAAEPWGVVDVTSAAGTQFPLTITSPIPEATVSSPLPVTFALTGGEDDVYVSAWAAGAGSAAATKHLVTSVGATVTLDQALPAAGTGYVVVADGSTGSGAFALSRLAVTPVSFGTGADAASSYVAIVAGRLHVFDAATNAEIRQLAPGATGVTQVAVSDDRQWVYYLKDDVPCGGRVWKTKLDGTGSPVPETTWLSGLSAFGIAGGRSQWLSYVYTPCGAGGQTLFWSVGGDQLEPPSTSSLSRPPELTTIAISPDGQEASGALRTGMQRNVYTFSRAQATPGGPAVDPSAPPVQTLAD
ncbi:MAG: hypothetical protein QOE76_1790, partial [Frankiales bacterium]|nr:hypothetical protein [Frankiales bacterium]